MARGWSSDDFESYLETSVDARFFVPMPMAEARPGPARAGDARSTARPISTTPCSSAGRRPCVVIPMPSVKGEEGYLLTAEYRMPLFLMPISPDGEIIGAGFHLFTDAGDAWYHGAEAGTSMFSYGAGLHLNIDTLQLRFEAARTREGDWMFEFMDKFNF